MQVLSDNGLFFHHVLSERNRVRGFCLSYIVLTERITFVIKCSLMKGVKNWKTEGCFIIIRYYTLFSFLLPPFRKKSRIAGKNYLPAYKAFFMKNELIYFLFFVISWDGVKNALILSILGFYKCSQNKFQKKLPKSGKITQLMSN